MAEIKTSGKKQEFFTGAHRDSQDNKGRFDLIPIVALKRLAIHYENGAKIYGENNWQKGIPLRRFLDSAIRHILDCLENNKDENEDHAAAALWNICGFMFTKDAIKRGFLPKELDNLPRYEILKSKTEDSKIEDSNFSEKFIPYNQATRCMCNRKDGKYKCDKYKERRLVIKK